MIRVTTCLNPFQGLVGVSMDMDGAAGARSSRLNPFQGLVGVSIIALEDGRDGVHSSQSLSGFGRCFYPEK